ncbi:hypothetical protein NDU88_006538 [Pleurodeles waltl]|uniref:Uncharacterized protein n=1 Tax=Pleurodeles waltl TaxID=8319 RepID=A0AAV7WB32_PLEWA|nr:hypothetical protein NDU88_006538 [Pleurodeles waltl]
MTGETAQSSTALWMAGAIAEAWKEAGVGLACGAEDSEEGSARHCRSDALAGAHAWKRGPLCCTEEPNARGQRRAPGATSEEETSGGECPWDALRPGGT